MAHRTLKITLLLTSRKWQFLFCGFVVGSRSDVDNIVKDVFWEIREELRSRPDHGPNFEDCPCAEMAFWYRSQRV